MSQLILLRHGQSMWNKANIFTGWVDVPLSLEGIEEALQAGQTLADTPIDSIFTSVLMRAQQTAMLAMTHHSSNKIPVTIQNDQALQDKSTIYSKKALSNTIPTYTDWRLNERYYGELQGANKAETIEKYGKEQVHIWRRSFDISPPAGESLKTTAERTLPCLFERIEPELKQGRNCLVSAHGNSLRSIIMHIENISPEDITGLEIPTGKPRLYDYNQTNYTLRGQ